MRKFIDDVLSDVAHQAEKPVEGLDNWGLYNDYDLILDDYRMWVMSNYQVCPYPGSWRDQPWHVRKDFVTLSKIESWHVQNAKRTDASKLRARGD
jgi:hypothetical protein